MYGEIVGLTVHTVHTVHTERGNSRAARAQLRSDWAGRQRVGSRVMQVELAQASPSSSAAKCISIRTAVNGCGIKRLLLDESRLSASFSLQRAGQLAATYLLLHVSLFFNVRVKGNVIDATFLFFRANQKIRIAQTKCSFHAQGVLLFV